MSQVKNRTSVAAGAVEANILAGSKFEFLSRPAVISVWAVQETAVDDIELSLTLGNTVVFEDALPNFVGSGIVSRLQDLMGSGLGEAGDRIQLRARNTDGAAARVVDTLVDIAEIA